MTPERRKELRQRWIDWQTKKYSERLMSLVFEPNVGYYRLFKPDEPIPPYQRYCIDSWTPKGDPR